MGVPKGFELTPECEADVAKVMRTISTIDDPLTLYVNAQSMAERVPGARLVTIESGGHILLGHEERIRSEIVVFLQEHSSSKVAPH